MFLKIFFILQLLGLGANAQQNLVPNPSFEDYKHCPSNLSQIDSLLNWYNPTGSSPDYFNSCFSSTLTTGPGVPYNYFKYQFPRKGNAYGGIYLYADSLNPDFRNSREYIAVKLIGSLEEDSIYCTELYVNQGNLHWFNATSNVHVYFSKDSIYRKGILFGADTLNYEPQIKNDTSNYITDTLNWTRVHGAFKAEGGERYIAIGNFYDNKHTHLKNFISPSLRGPDTYVYIDDVSVMRGECKEDTIKKFFFNLYPNPNNGKFFLNYGIHNNSTFTLYDVLGRTVMKTTLNKEQSMQEFNLYTLAGGMYFIRVTDANELLHSTKIIITH